MEHLTRMAEFESDHRRPQTNCDSDSPCPDENCPRHFVRKVEYLLKAKALHLDPDYVSKHPSELVFPIEYNQDQVDQVDHISNWIDGLNDINACDDDGNTLLHDCCRFINSTHPIIFDILLKRGAKINSQNRFGFTPLHLALAHFRPSSSSSILTLLLSYPGLNVNLTTLGGSTPLFLACININNLPSFSFRMLLELYDRSIIEQVFTQFDYLLENMPRFPISNQPIKIDVNYSGSEGDSIFDIACSHISDIPFELFKDLIEVQNADLNDEQNLFSIHTAVENFRSYGDMNNLFYLCSLPNVNVNKLDLTRSTLLHKACKNIANIPLSFFNFLIIQHSCCISQPDWTAQTPIQIAIRNFKFDNDDAILHFLLEKSKVEEQPLSSTILLHDSIINNHVPFSVQSYLINQHNANVWEKTSTGLSSLHLILKHYRPSPHNPENCVKYYLDMLDDVTDDELDYSQTLFQSACENASSLPCWVYSSLINRHGSNINDRNAVPTLVRAFDRRYNLKTLIYLLTHPELDIHAVNNDRSTILHHICSNLHHIPHEIVPYMVETRGANVSTLDAFGHTPTQIALSNYKRSQEIVMNYLIIQHQEGEVERQRLLLALIPPKKISLRSLSI